MYCFWLVVLWILFILRFGGEVILVNNCGFCLYMLGLWRVCEFCLMYLVCVINVLIDDCIWRGNLVIVELCMVDWCWVVLMIVFFSWVVDDFWYCLIGEEWKLKWIIVGVVIDIWFVVEFLFV